MEKKSMLKMNLQMFAEKDLTMMDDLGKIKTIDFVERFSYSIAELLEVLGNVRKLPLVQDQKIQTYKFTTTKPTTQAAEGENIPLTKVERKEYKDYTIPLNKYRKVTTAEAIRRHGSDLAINQTDRQMLQSIQGDVKASFFEFLTTAPTKQSANSLQSGLSLGWAKARQYFKDMGNVPYVSFVNTMDVANWLGDGKINAVQGTQYGFVLLKDFLNQNVIMFDDVPQGKIYTTAVDNIVFAYQNMANSDLAREFELTTDESGLIGVTHSKNKQNATIETMAMQGSTLFTEVVDGVVETSIEGSGEVPETGGEAKSGK